MRIVLYGHTTCWLSQLSGILVLLVIYACMLPSAVCQCCQKFLNGMCISCPADTRLVLGNCLFNKPNCIAYNVFQCTKCTIGYALDDNNNCFMLNGQDITTGYFYLTQQQINTNFIQTLAQEIKNNMATKLDGLNLITVLAANINQELSLVFPLAYQYYFRFVFSADLGFLEYNYQYTPNTTNYTPDSTPLVADFVEKKIKIFTLNDQNNVNEVFIDFRQDPNAGQILKDLQTRNIKTKDTRFIDVFRYFSPAFEKVPPVYGYRIFMVSPSRGLFQESRTITISLVDIINLDPIISNVLEEIKKMKNWTVSLNNTQLVSLIVLGTTSNGISTYNATYKHLDITDPQTKSLARSWFIFTWQQLPTTVKIDVTDSSIYPELQTPTTTTTTTTTTSTRTTTTTNTTNSTNTEVKAAVKKPIITPISPVVKPTPPERKTASWLSIPNTINFQQYISLLQFFKLKDFSSILTYLNTNFVKYTVGQDIIRASQGENTTHKIYELSFRVYSLEQINAQYLFTLNKDKNQLEIVQFILTNAANRTDIVVDSRNRQSVVNGFDAITNDMVKNIVVADSQYSAGSQLFQYSTQMFKKSESSPISKRISLKYYFPTQLNKTYQFIEYRGEINDTQNSNKIEKINTIIFPKQVYQLVDDTDNLTRDTVIFAVEQILINQLTNTSYNITRVFKSLDRVGYFRVEINFMGLYLVLYEFDSNSNTYIRSITNKTLSTQAKPRKSNNSGVDTKRLLLANSSPPAEPIPPKAYNPLYFFQYFPAKTATPIPIPIKQPSADSPYICQNELKAIIANFFNLKPQSITTVTILSLQTIEDMIDNYYVEFTRSCENRNHRNCQFYRFSFQIDRKSQKSPTNIAAAAFSLRRSTQAPVLPVPAHFSDTITIPFEQSQNKPVSILEQIFNRSFKIKNSKQSNTNSAELKQKIEEFRQNIPSIIPISFEQNLNFTQIPPRQLTTPNKPTTSTIDFFNKNLAIPNIYTSSLAKVSAQRNKKTNGSNGVKLISIAHFYYGNIILWCELTEYKLHRINYQDQFNMKSRGVNIIKQIPELTNIHQQLASNITQTLTYFGYQQKKSQKITKQSDIIYWKYKKLPTLNQLQLYYQFSTFLIKAGILVNQQQTKIIQFIVINNNKKGNLKLWQMRKILYSNYFMKACYELYYDYGYYFEDGDIIWVEAQHQGESINYLVIFQTPQGFINVNMIFNTTNLTTTVQYISEPTSKTPLKLLQGCEKSSQVPMQCKQCYFDYYLHKNDKVCYLKIRNCSFQSRQICLECQQGFFLTSDDKCE